MYRDTFAHDFHAYQHEMSLGLMHAASSKRSRIQVAIAAFYECLRRAVRMGRPDLASRANELLAIVGA